VGNNLKREKRLIKPEIVMGDGQLHGVIVGAEVGTPEEASEARDDDGQRDAEVLESLIRSLYFSAPEQKGLCTVFIHTTLSYRPS
jgi:hypothetical protein